MTQPFHFLMLSAMYENGGNTTHRFLDGHPQMHVYPFESQVGTSLVADRLSSTFPVKYRWPVFPLDGTPQQDYHRIIDEECKVRTKTPQVSKFRHMPFDLTDADRLRHYVRHVGKSGRSRANNITAFFRSTFDAWKDYRRSGREKFYVGYSPIIVVDADKIVQDLPNGHVLHVVRNPWSAYADTKKRPMPLSLADYMLAWTLNQYHALLFQKKYPKRVHVLRTEDILANPRGQLGRFCKSLGLDTSDTLGRVTWNGEPLSQVFPWGTIRIPTPEANRRTAQELSPQEHAEIRDRAQPYLERFDYKKFL